MDVPELFLIAAAVLDVDPAEVFDRTDLDAVGRTFQAIPPEAPALEQAAALLHAIIRERPFGDDSRAVAVVAAAQVLELDGKVTTFKPSDRLFALLDGIADGTVDVETVCSFLSVEVTPMFERFTPRARNVITHAYSEAKALQHNFVGTEHLLLGLLRESDGIGALVLTDMGVDIDVVRREIEHRIGRGTEDVPNRSPFTPRSKTSARARAQRGHPDGPQLHRHGAPAARPAARRRRSRRRDPDRRVRHRDRPRAQRRHHATHGHRLEAATGAAPLEAVHAPVGHVGLAGRPGARGAPRPAARRHPSAARREHPAPR